MANGAPPIGHPPELAAVETALGRALMPWVMAAAAIVGSVFFALGGWAYSAPIAQAVIAQGLVKVDSNRKRVQHLEGGTVRRIMVADGDSVTAGDVLVRLDDTRAKASLGIIRSSQDAELARFARLTSERDSQPTVTYPPELMNRAGDPAVRELLLLQDQLFLARRQSLASSVEILTRQISQLDEKRGGIVVQLQALDAQDALVAEELNSLQTLFDRGYSDKSRMLALEKEAARIAGERGELTSESAETANLISQKQQEVLQLRYDFTQSVVDELRDAQTKLLDIQERMDAAAYVLDNIEVRAHVDGVVVGLSVFSAGEVIKPGDVLLELVPSNEALTVEAKVRLTDVDNLVIGQEADVRFTAFDARNTPVIIGTVGYVSADALEDERTGEAFYRAKINVAANQLERLGQRELQPGMPADVIIKTGERTVLQYLYQPISNALAKAWSEE